MGSVPQGFGSVPPNASASYDYFDIAAGTGVVQFYAANGPSGTNFLTENQIYSDLIILGNEFATINTADGQGAKISFDFDVTFNKPQDIEGTCIVEIPHGWRDTGNQTTNQRMHAYIRKWDGATEINLVSMSGSEWLASGQGAGVETKTTLSTLSGEIPFNHFKAGETLRLTVEDSTWEAGGNTHHIFIGADPQGRLTNDKARISNATLTFASGDVTALRCFVPFRIDL